jgi:hypothetical protein
MRELRLAEQQNGKAFNYKEFKEILMSAELTPAQLAPLHQRLDDTESFMSKYDTSLKKHKTSTGRKKMALTQWAVAVSLHFDKYAFFN